MLVLTRKQGESMKIGKEIKVKVLSVKGKRVQIGIDSPKELKIRRGEF